MHHEGRVDARDTQKRDMLLEAQEKLLKRLNDPVRGNKGLFVELDEANQKIQYAKSIQLENFKEEPSTDVSSG